MYFNATFLNSGVNIYQIKMCDRYLCSTQNTQLLIKFLVIILNPFPPLILLLINLLFSNCGDIISIYTELRR